MYLHFIEGMNLVFAQFSWMTHNPQRFVKTKLPTMLKLGNIQNSI